MLSEIYFWGLVKILCCYIRMEKKIDLIAVKDFKKCYGKILNLSHYS